MNEGEKEAIEQFKSWRDYIIKHKEKVNKANDLEFYIRTILNLITKLQKQNETTIKLNTNMNKRHLNDSFKIKNCEKQIDLMAEYINNIQDCPLENCGVNLDCENRCNNDEKTIKQCWIKYFEKLAKESRG